MKPLLTILALAISAAAFADPVALPLPEWADTETSTNVPFVWRTTDRVFSLELDFAATPSKNVTTAPNALRVMLR